MKNQASTDKLQHIYKDFYLEMESSDEGELTKFGKSDISRILKANEIEDYEKVKELFEEMIDIEDYKLTGSNILPALKNNSLKVETESLKISTSPTNIKDIKKISNEKGETYIQIKIEDLDLFVDGLEIK